MTLAEMSDYPQNLVSQRFGKLTVQDKLGGGGQGEVFLVDSTRGKHALKWFNSVWASSASFKRAIEYLVHEGPPNDPEGVARNFLWPIDLISDSDGGFGYLMDLMKPGYFDWEDVRFKPNIPQPNRASLCKISFFLAHSFRSLHLTGHCYKDISDKNILVDPKSGEISICDNDNVRMNNVQEPDDGITMGGTDPFKAPEIMLGNSLPNTLSDLHSLAVLLFMIWMRSHPLHGSLYYDNLIIDEEVSKEIYGLNPVFIFDPNNGSNRVPDEYGRGAIKRWQACPEPLKKLFIRAFTEGLKDPNRRIPESEWRSLFLQLYAGVTKCKNCAKGIILTVGNKIKCWNCDENIPIQPTISFEKDGVISAIPLLKTTKIYPHHLKPRDNAAYERTNVVVGEVIPHPYEQGAWVLRNNTDQSWTLRLKDGQTKPIPPKKYIRIKKSHLNNLAEIFMDGARVTIQL